MQEALTKQLTAEDERLRYDLMEKQKALASLEAEKEEIGVRLYEAQQKLVRLQANAESDQLASQNSAKVRQENEELLRNLEEQVRAAGKETAELEAGFGRRLDELSRQNLAFQQIDDFWEKLQSELNIKRRETYKAEENTAAEERRKERQDYLLSSLEEERKKAKAAKEVLEAKLELQRREREEALKMLAESQSEVEKVMVSKRNLLQNLRRALIDLEEKNKVLEVAKDALYVQTEQIERQGSEIKGCQREQAAERALIAKWAALKEQLEREEAGLARERDQAEQKARRVQAKIGVLTSALEAADTELKALNAKEIKLRAEMKNVEANAMRMHREAREKTEEIALKIGEHQTLSKLQKATMKRAIEFETQSRELEAEAETLENELARVQLQRLTDDRRLAGLEDLKRSAEREREAKEKAISEAEAEIKRNHDAHEKKMLEVARFNREHEKAAQRGAAALAAPSEAALAGLEEQRGSLEGARKRVEGEFIRQQSQNVEKELGLGQLLEETAELARKETILGQKQLRLNGEYAAFEREIRGLEGELRAGETEMARLNDCLAEFLRKAGSESGKGAAAAADFAEKLKGQASLAATIELEIDRLREAKAELLREAMEAERQGLLWERKIDLEKEMQATLDPAVGQIEITATQKNLHVFGLELAKLKKEQEALVVEVERAIHKRDNIAVKYQTKENSNPNAKWSVSKTAKEIETLKAAIAFSQKNLAELEARTSKTAELLRQTLAKKTEKLKVLSYITDALPATERRAALARLDKLLTELKTFRAQKLALALEKVARKGSAPPANQTLLQKIESSKERVHNLVKVAEAALAKAEETHQAIGFLKEVAKVVDA